MLNICTMCRQLHQAHTRRIGFLQRQLAQLSVSIMISAWIFVFDRSLVSAASAASRSCCDLPCWPPRLLA